MRRRKLATATRTHRPGRRLPHLASATRRLRFESLEDRRLLSINVTGLPDWVEEGPGPIVSSSIGGENTDGIANSPAAGAVGAIAVDPTDANTVYVGAVNGGVWKTTNASADSPHWVPLTDQLPSLSISAIAISPFDSHVVYAGTGRMSNAVGTPGAAVGLYKTTDGGATWSLLGGDTLADLTISNVALSRADANVILVSTTGAGGKDAALTGVYRTADGGASWQRIGVAGGLPDGLAMDIIADPIDNQVFYAALPAHGIFKRLRRRRKLDGVRHGLGGRGSNHAHPSVGQPGRKSPNLRCADWLPRDDSVGRLTGQ